MGDNDSTEERVTELHAPRTKSTRQMWQKRHTEDFGETETERETIPNSN